MAFLEKLRFALFAAQLVLILGCTFPWASAGLWRGNSHLLLHEVLGSLGPAWVGSVIGTQNVDSDDESGSLESLFSLLSQLGTFIQESLQWLAEWMRSPWCIWNSGTHLSILDPGMCKPAAWEGTDSFPWLRFIWCLISITLQSHSPTWSSCWYLSPLLHTSSMVVAVPERRKVAWRSGL